MGLEKGQQDFCEDLESTMIDGEITELPINTGVLAHAQKSNSEGPKFDFSATNVTIAEKSLRKVISEIKDNLEKLVPDCKNEVQFSFVVSTLNPLLPKLYLHYDNYVKEVIRTSEEPISCQKGCANCCSHYVTSVEPFELLYLHQQIRSDTAYPGKMIALHRRVSLFKSLLNPSEKDTDTADADEEDKALYRYFLRGQPCPFLQAGGACGVYAHRPMSCRMFYSLSNPSLCKGKGVIAPENRNFLIELPDDIEADISRIGALFADFDLPGHLFEGLLEVNEKFGQYELEESVTTTPPK